MRKDYEPASLHPAAQGERAFLEEFWTRHWETAGRAAPPESVTRREEYRLMEPYLRRLPPTGRLLDGGCGLGEWTVYLTGRGFEVVGLDLSQATIERLSAAWPQCRFVCGDIRQTGFPDASFDAYFSWGTFEHFEQGMGECIVEAYRLLKPGGWLFISVPFHNWRLILRDARRLPAPADGAAGVRRFYQWRLTGPELRHELEIRGLRVQAIKAIAKDQGVHRWLQWDVRLWREGTLPFAVARRALSLVMPSRFISHMIWAAAQKPE